MRERGTITWWSPKGYGYITRDGHPRTETYFIHFRALLPGEPGDELFLGEELEYDLDLGPDGRLRAARAKRVPLWSTPVTPAAYDEDR